MAHQAPNCAMAYPRVRAVSFNDSLGTIIIDFRVLNKMQTLLSVVSAAFGQAQYYRSRSSSVVWRRPIK
jgi:hypothetical protein